MGRKLKLSLRLYSLKPEKECTPSDIAYYGTHMSFYFEILEDPLLDYDEPKVRMVIKGYTHPIIWLKLFINPKGKKGMPVSSRSRQGRPKHSIYGEMLMGRVQYLILKDEGVIESNS